MHVLIISVSFRRGGGGALGYPPLIINSIPIREISSIWYNSLVPRPLPVFIVKNLEWPGDEATIW